MLPAQGNHTFVLACSVLLIPSRSNERACIASTREAEPVSEAIVSAVSPRTTPATWPCNALRLDRTCAATPSRRAWRSSPRRATGGNSGLEAGPPPRTTGSGGCPRWAPGAGAWARRTSVRRAVSGRLNWSRKGLQQSAWRRGSAHQPAAPGVGATAADNPSASASGSTLWLGVPPAPGRRRRTGQGSPPRLAAWPPPRPGGSGACRPRGALGPRRCGPGVTQAAAAARCVCHGGGADACAGPCAGRAHGRAACETG
jgi:hypothetical protein